MFLRINILQVLVSYSWVLFKRIAEAGKGMNLSSFFDAWITAKAAGESFVLIDGRVRSLPSHWKSDEFRRYISVTIAPTL
jgi:hypothetical protein